MRSLLPLLLLALAGCAKSYDIEGYTVIFEIQDEKGRAVKGSELKVYNPHACDRGEIMDFVGEVKEPAAEIQELVADDTGRVSMSVPASSGYCGFPGGSPRHWLYADSVRPDPLAVDMWLLIYAEDLPVAIFWLAGTVGAEAEPEVLAPAVRPGVGNPFERVSFDLEPLPPGDGEGWKVRLRERRSTEADPRESGRRAQTAPSTASPPTRRRRTKDRP